MTTSGYLIDSGKFSMSQIEEGVKQYLKAFEIEYDTTSGLRIDFWVEVSIWTSLSPQRGVINMPSERSIII